MALEWLDGESLDVTLERERAEEAPPRTVECALRLLEPIARALTLAHDQGIVHRDVKPGNICLLKDAAVRGTTPTKLYDFGLAMSFHGVAPGQSGEPGEGGEGVLRFSFTPGYAAPEQYSSEHGDIGPWTDVFALALVFLELITGKPAMPGATVNDLRLHACNPHSRPTPRAHRVHVGDGIERVLGRALAVRPEDRFAHAGDFWTALTRAAKERMHEATIPIMLMKPRRAKARWVLPALAFGSGAAALAVISHWAAFAQLVAFVH
jgi:serine/threonine protein kinase